MIITILFMPLTWCELGGWAMTGDKFKTVWWFMSKDIIIIIIVDMVQDLCTSIPVKSFFPLND